MSRDFPSRSRLRGQWCGHVKGDTLWRECVDADRGIGVDQATISARNGSATCESLVPPCSSTDVSANSTINPAQGKRLVSRWTTGRRETERERKRSFGDRARSSARGHLGPRSQSSALFLYLSSFLLFRFFLFFFSFSFSSIVSRLVLSDFGLGLLCCSFYRESETKRGIVKRYYV